MSVQPRSLLLAVLLLAGQFALTLHQFEFDQHPGGAGECTLCLAAQGGAHVGPGFGSCPAATAIAEPPLRPSTDTLRSPAPAFQLARAPPLPA